MQIVGRKIEVFKHIAIVHTSIFKSLAMHDKQELEKRANSRVSRKERLRKEVMRAREMDSSENVQS